jgi:hypothetical protein
MQWYTIVNACDSVVAPNQFKGEIQNAYMQNKVCMKAVRLFNLHDHIILSLYQGSYLPKCLIFRSTDQNLVCIYYVSMRATRRCPEKSFESFEYGSAYTISGSCSESDALFALRNCAQPPHCFCWQMLQWHEVSRKRQVVFVSTWFITESEGR